MKHIFVLSSILGFLILSTACPKPVRGIVEACESYKAFRECEAGLRDKMPPSMDCKALSGKFQFACTQEDIDYTHEVFKSAAEKICTLLKNRHKEAEIDESQLKISFDMKRISKGCVHASNDGDLSFIFNDDI